MLPRSSVFVIRVDKGQQVDAAVGCCMTSDTAAADVPDEREENNECDNDAGDESTDSAAI